MNTRYYIPYFPSNPYGAEAPAKAMDAAKRLMPENRLTLVFERRTGISLTFMSN